MAVMKVAGSTLRFLRGNLSRNAGAGVLLLLGGLAVAGPSGLFAWGENQRMLVERQSEVTRLMAERDELKNRVALLDPAHADPDLAGELLRKSLNVLHPDEVVMILK